MRLIFIALIIVLSGCQKTPLKPLEGHIYCVPKGVEIRTTNQGVKTTRYEGVWMSEFYLNEMWQMGMPE